jgi:integrase/recombinase XerD
MNAQTGTRDFPTVVQRFFCDYLMNQRNVSPRTIAAYRDTFRLLLRELQTQSGKSASELEFPDLDAPAVLAFLRSIEKDRGNSIRTRNARLAAIRAFANYAASEETSFLATARQIRVIPMKRFDRPLIGFLSREEIQAILDAPTLDTWSGRRDRAMLTALYNTGARVSEIIAVRMKDICLDAAPSMTLHGKGRKERVVPLWKSTACLLRHWIKETDSEKDAPLFPGCRGQPLSRSGVEERLRRAVKSASAKCPSFSKRPISPHTFRHTTAMHMLQSGVDITVIALWLGHESISTTHMYIEADLAMKQKALDRLHAPGRQPHVYRAPDKLLEFLRAL